MNDSKICIVSMDNVKRVPYIFQYIKCLNGRAFDFLYWNRDCSAEDVGASRTLAFCHMVRHGGQSFAQLWEKLTGYLGFRRFARRVLRDGRYERIVCLTGNCAVLVGDVLANVYAGRFIMDIRDYWHEDNKWYHEAEQRLIKASAFTVISSPAYREFLGEHDFRVMHNTQLLTDEQKTIAKGLHDLPLHIACIGAAKNLAYDKKVIDLFANDERFLLSFRGRGYDQLADYIQSKQYKNIRAEGEFDFAKTLDQYTDVDVILSMYGSGSPYWDYALSNKLYFAAQLELPILVCKGTAIGDYVDEYGLGIAFDPADIDVKDRIARLFDCDVSMERRAGCSRFLANVERDNSRTLSDVEAFFCC